MPDADSLTMWLEMPRLRREASTVLASTPDFFAGWLLATLPEESVVECPIGYVYFMAPDREYHDGVAFVRVSCIYVTYARSTDDGRQVCHSGELDPVVVRLLPLSTDRLDVRIEYWEGGVLAALACDYVSRLVAEIQRRWPDADVTPAHGAAGNLPSPTRNAAQDNELAGLQAAYRQLCAVYRDCDDEEHRWRRPTRDEFCDAHALPVATFKRRLKRLRATWKADFATLPVDTAGKLGRE